MTKEEKWIFDEKYNGKIAEQQSNDFLNDCKRLEAGEPLAYIIGCIPFLNTTIYLDSKPLIPRPETEFWAEKVIEVIKSRIKLPIKDLTPVTPIAEVRDAIPYLRILDLCSGSGCIGVAVAKAIPEAKVTFGEIDPAHIPTITKNIQQNIFPKPSNQLEGFGVVISDLFENITGTFDFILTNPPYIDALAHTVETSVADNEPSLALYGGLGGFEIIKRIITDAKKYLKPHGALWIEHEPSQVTDIQTHASLMGFEVTIHNDQYGVTRFSILVLQ